MTAEATNLSMLKRGGDILALFEHWEKLHTEIGEIEEALRSPYITAVAPLCYIPDAKIRKALQEALEVREVKKVAMGKALMADGSVDEHYLLELYWERRG